MEILNFSWTYMCSHIFGPYTVVATDYSLKIVSTEMKSYPL